MRKLAAVLLALIFAGSVGGVGCSAAASAAAASTMDCCTADCPAPTAPRPAQSCATPACAPSVEVAPSGHRTIVVRSALAWVAAFAPPLALRAILLTPAAAPRSASPPSADSSLAFERLCSRQI
ncbi:MAG TPA: hypothetical protein VL393_11345 [Candidatus Binataceae bacterium]|nr:hypothetical protein [Candidatus Binataceae bacterium]